MTHFGREPRSAEDAVTDDPKTASRYALHLMSSGDFLLPGHPSGISAAHTDGDVRKLVTNSRRFADQLRLTK